MNERRASPPAFTRAPPPLQAPARTGLVSVPGGNLYFWDTGGEGETVRAGCLRGATLAAPQGSAEASVPSASSKGSRGA